MPYEEVFDGARRTAEELGRRLAAAARDVARTQEHLAATFDEIAERSPGRARWLNAMAADAREHAAAEREYANRMNEDDASDE